MWLGDPNGDFTGHRDGRPMPGILGVRKMEHADLAALEKLVHPDTYSVFGNVNLPRIYEASSLSVVQWNEKHDLVSGICLCNYPNVPAVTPEDWPSWQRTLYGAEDVTERNTLFMHFLAWDHRYNADRFFEELMNGLFAIAPYLLHVILVNPPRVIPGDPSANRSDSPSRRNQSGETVLSAVSSSGRVREADGQGPSEVPDELARGAVAAHRLQIRGDGPETEGPAGRRGGQRLGGAADRRGVLAAQGTLRRVLRQRNGSLPERFPAADRFRGRGRPGQRRDVSQQTGGRGHARR
nr:uncharacterized protein LOC117219588 isoform X2 [Megalopta genalis]